MRRLPRFCRWVLCGLLLAGFVVLPAVLLWTGFAGRHLEAQVAGLLLLTVTVFGGGSALAKRLRERRNGHQ